MSEKAYGNVRDPDMLGPVLGQRVVDITQHDAEEFAETRESYVMLHFENGIVLRIPISDEGFDVLNHPNAESDE